MMCPCDKISSTYTVRGVQVTGQAKRQVCSVVQWIIPNRGEIADLRVHPVESFVVHLQKRPKTKHPSLKKPQIQNVQDITFLLQNVSTAKRPSYKMTQASIGSQLQNVPHKKNCCYCLNVVLVFRWQRTASLLAINWYQ